MKYAGVPTGPGGPRRYEMRARAESTRATRERILDSAHALMLERSYDVLTLADVAEAAGVTFQTVLRHFGSKDGLVAAVAQSRGQQEFARRDALSGDARDVARVLCDRYEATGDAMVHWEALEDRVEVVGRAIAGARAGHAAWLRDKFSGQLESLGPREARLTIAALQAVTDIGTWRLWRRRLGLPKADVRTNMERLIEGALAAAHDVEVKCRSGRAAAKKRRRDG